MNTVNYLLLGYLTACAIAYLVSTLPSVRPARARRWAARHGLPTTDDVLERVGQGRAGRGRAIGIGTLAVAWPAFLGLALMGPGLGDVTRGFLLAVLTILGSCVGVVLYAFRTAGRGPVGPVRVAHSTAPRLQEFARPALMVCIRVTTAVGMAAAVLAGLLSGSGAAWTTAIAVALGWSAAELAAARLIRAPQRSSRAVDLDVDDALRGELVRDLYSLPAVLALVAAATGAAVVDRAGESLTGGALSTMAAVGVALAAVSVLVLTVWVQFPARRAHDRRPPAVASRPVA